MKKILITGAGSYIGTSVEKWLSRWPEKYKTDTLDMKNESWRNKDFSGYDVVFHVAGIAHVSKDSSLDELYFRVNRDLAVETAQKAKREGAGQFIFMSSGILYGIDQRVGVPVMISEHTVPHPVNAYGKSKWQADAAIQKLSDEKFHAVCIRTPMVYGKGCKGNFVLLRDKIARFPVIPRIKNVRSMIHIENLANFIKERIEKGDAGVFFPQNEDYVSTSQMIREIRSIRGKKTYESRLLGWAVKISSRLLPICRKAYGDLAYDKKLTETGYIVNGFRESIEKSL